MDDLLTLDYSAAENVKIIGVDRDVNSLKLAQQNADLHNLQDVAAFSQQDAWSLEETSIFDLITSNGLNIYEKDDERVINLYKEFWKALKQDGILVTSFLTPPPTLSEESTWHGLIQEDLLKQKALFGDIIQAGWQSFRTEHQTRRQLGQAGFEVLEVIYDDCGCFPTIIAKKLES